MAADGQGRHGAEYCRELPAVVPVGCSSFRVFCGVVGRALPSGGPAMMCTSSTRLASLFVVGMSFNRSDTWTEFADMGPGSGLHKEICPELYTNGTPECLAS